MTSHRYGREHYGHGHCGHGRGHRDDDDEKTFLRLFGELMGYDAKAFPTYVHSPTTQKYDSRKTPHFELYSMFGN